MRNAMRPYGRRALAVGGLAALIVMVVLAPAGARAQAPPADGAAGAARAVATPAGVPLVVFGDTIAWLRATVAGIGPPRRVEIAHERLEAFDTRQMMQSVRAEPIEGGHMMLLGDMFVFMFMDADSAAGTPTPGKAAVVQAGERLGRTLRGRAEALAPGRRLVALGWAVAGTLILLVLLRLLHWGHRLTRDWIATKSQVHGKSLKLGDVDLIARFTWLVTWLVRAGMQLAAVVLVVIWAVYVLNRFPETQPAGALARATLIGAVQAFERGALRALPGIIMVALIVFAARFASRLASEVFSGIERGTIRLPGVHPETAHATRRLVTTAIWLFAVVVAYPLLPGSGSDAFKGVSVFLGLMVTLGSSGVMGHMMSGLVIVYSRSLQAGDFVRVNDLEGMVSEVGALSVKLVNSRREEFTIPNAVIVGTTVKNYSRLDRELGPALTTGVTIGYDAPWRVVYEMLLAAADRTAGVRKEPAPKVFQPELSDFYVVYQLSVRVEPGADRLRVLTELHQNIQDVFNERGVQIMSPHFEGQPDDRVWVPKAKWTVAPGDPPR